MVYKNPQWINLLTTSHVLGHDVSGSGVIQRKLQTASPSSVSHRLMLLRLSHTRQPTDLWAPDSAVNHQLDKERVKCISAATYDEAGLLKLYDLQVDRERVTRMV